MMARLSWGLLAAPAGFPGPKWPSGRERDGTRVTGAGFPKALVVAIILVGALLGVPSIARATVAPLAFIPTSGSLSVLNTADNQPVTTIPSGYVNALAFTPDGRFAYVLTGFETGTVLIINTSTAAVVGRISVGADPVAVAFTPNGRYAYVADFEADSVAIIDTATLRVVATVAIGPDPFDDDTDSPTDVAITPNGAFAYVTTDGDLDTLEVISTATHRVVANTNTGIKPSSVVIAPNGEGVYADANSELFVVSPGTNRPVTQTSGRQIFAFSPNDSFAYLPVFEPQFGYPDITVLNTATNTVATSISVATDQGPYGSEGEGGSDGTASPNGQYLYIPSWYDYYYPTSSPPQSGSGCLSTMSVVNTTSNTVVATIPVSGDCNPPGLPAFTADGSRAYALTSQGLAEINTATNTLLATIPIGDAADATGVYIPSGTAAPACGTSFLARLICDYKVVQRLKSTAQCGVDVFFWVEVKIFKTLPLIKLLAKNIKNVRKLQTLKAALKPLYNVYNDLVALRKKFGRGPMKNLLKRLEKASTVWDAVNTIFDWARLTVDNLRPVELKAFSHDFNAFVRDFAELAGVGDCVDLVLGDE